MWVDALSRADLKEAETQPNAAAQRSEYSLFN